MRKIFLDANVVIDYLNVESKDHSAAKTCMKIIRDHYGKPVVSPFTFLITNHLAGKYAKDKKWHRLQMQTLFGGFEITSFRSADIQRIFEGKFVDLEDGLQHECAVSANTAVIVTKNVHDFFASTIPAVHPLDFIQRFDNLL